MIQTETYPCKPSRDPQSTGIVTKTTQKVAGIFIAYRNVDVYGAALLDVGLSKFYGEEAIFRAGRSIKAGENFSDVIGAAISNCDVMLAIMGPGWAESIDAGRHPWLRREIQLAQWLNKRIIPTHLADLSLLNGENPRHNKMTLPAGIGPSLADVRGCEFSARNHEASAAGIAQSIGNVVTSKVEICIDLPHE